MNLTRRNVLTALSAAAAAQGQRKPPPNWKPKLGVLCSFSDANLAFVKAEGFTSMQLRLDPNKLDDAAISEIKSKIQSAGIYVSSLACDGNHIDPDPAARAKQNAYASKCIELAGKLGIPGIGGQSGPVGWSALFKAFNNSPHVGLQFDPSHLVWQFMDPVAAAREFVDKIYDVHLKDTEILWHIVRRGGIQPVDNARWWRFRVPGYGSVDWKGFFSVLSEAGYTGAMNIENEDNFYYPGYENGDFTEQYKRGFRVAHEFLKTLVPPLTA
jgi:sugar phosphate isomerase/epimerase